MKHLKLLALLALVALAFSCKKTDPPFLTLNSAESENVLTEGGVVNIKFSTNVPWAVEVSETWVTLSQTSGEPVEGGGEISIKASVVKNETTDPRSAVVTVSCPGQSALVKKVTITQGQMDALNVATTDYTVPAEGGAVEVTVSSNVDYKVEIPEAVDWVHVTGTKAMTDSKVTFLVDKTYDYDPDHLWDEGYDQTIVRTANVTITAGGLSKKISIGQNPFVPYYDMDIPNGGGQFSGYGDGDPLVIEADATGFTIPVSTNLEHYCYFAPWDSTVGAAVETNDVGWIKFTYDNEKIVFTVEPNTSVIPREEYFYSGCSVGDIDFSAFGCCILIRQKGLVPEAGASLIWTEQLSSVGISAAYNRLAFTASGALLVSDQVNIHAVNPADGSYWKKIIPTITPDSIDSDDAGNIIIAPDSEFAPGSTYNVYWTNDINSSPQLLFSHTADFDGVIGGFRIRGDIGSRAVVTGVITGNRYWAGWEIDKYDVSMDNYYAQATGGQARGPLAYDADTWNPQSGAVMSLATTLKDGIAARAYDTNWNLHYLKDAYTPNWITPYEWKDICEAGAGAGNENQCNMDIIDYGGRRIMAYTQGAWFTWGGNSDVYILDVTDPMAVEVLSIFDGSQLSQPEVIQGADGMASFPYADVLLRAEEGLGLTLYVVNSTYESLSKLLITF